MATKTLNFTIGENFGSLIQSIASEHVLYDFDVKKGMKTIQDSLIGMDEEMAFLILIGKFKLVVDVETQEVVVKAAEKKDPKIEFKHSEIIEWRLQNDAKILKHNLDIDINKMAKNPFYFSFDDLSEYFINDLDTAIIEQIDDAGVNIKRFLFVARDFVMKAFKRKQMYTDLNELAIKYGYPTLIDEEFTSIPLEVIILANAIRDYKRGAQPTEYEIDDDLDKYLNAARVISKTAEKGIQPIDITCAIG